MKWEKILPYIIIGLLLCLVVFLKQGKDSSTIGNDVIPVYVLETLETIETTGKAPKGYVGGRTFQNREKRLPKKDSDGKKVKYREWDVHPKVKGKNRGAERLVTGSDDNAYYTSDHYRSFTKINKRKQ